MGVFSLFRRKPKTAEEASATAAAEAPEVAQDGAEPGVTAHDGDAATEGGAETAVATSAHDGGEDAAGTDAPPAGDVAQDGAPASADAEASTDADKAGETSGGKVRETAPDSAARPAEQTQAPAEASADVTAAVTATESARERAADAPAPAGGENPEAVAENVEIPKQQSAERSADSETTEGARG